MDGTMSHILQLTSSASIFNKRCTFPYKSMHQKLQLYSIHHKDQEKGARCLLLA